MKINSLEDFRKLLIDNADTFLDIEVSDKPASMVVEPEPPLNISRHFDVKLNFDSGGNARTSISQYCPINISFSASITDVNAVFAVTLDTNFPQHLSWNNVKQGQLISGTIRTNVFSKTNGTLSVHSSVPNSTATIHIDCSL
jgi:hypothetical protein